MRRILAAIVSALLIGGNVFHDEAIRHSALLQNASRQKLEHGGKKMAPG